MRRIKIKGLPDIEVCLLGQWIPAHTVRFLGAGAVAWENRNFLGFCGRADWRENAKKENAEGAGTSASEN